MQRHAVGTGVTAASYSAIEALAIVGDNLYVGGEF